MSWGLKFVATLLVGCCLQDLAVAQPGRAETPCPCAADGTCHPRRETWGTYLTQWRVWPGEQANIVPEPEKAVESDIRSQLPIIERPRPDEEDLRGPAKPVAPEAPQEPTAVGAEEVPAAEAAPAAEAPANDGLQLPGFDPQGSLHQLPQIEDVPPALPKSLSQAMLVQSVPIQAPTQTMQRRSVTVIANSASATQQSVRHDPLVSPTTATTQPGPIELGNPAADRVYQPTAQDLQHAIYYEQQ
mgnify:FL=1